MMNIWTQYQLFLAGVDAAWGQNKLKATLREMLDAKRAVCWDGNPSVQGIIRLA